MIPADIKTDVKQQEIRELVAVFYFSLESLLKTCITIYRRNVFSEQKRTEIYPNGIEISPFLSP